MSSNAANNKNNVVKFPGGNATVDLTQFPSKKMYCPAREQMVTAYLIPLDMIKKTYVNPGRVKGTDPSAVKELAESLQVKELEEPVCGQWSPPDALFDLIFGYNRFGGHLTNDKNGISIPGTNGTNGIWMSIPSGLSAVDIKWLQGQENGNKRPSSPATKDDMAKIALEIIQMGGLDEPNSPYSSLNTDARYNRLRNMFKKKIPLWGKVKRRFDKVWKETQKKTNRYAAYSKSDLSDYYLTNPNPYGITLQDVQSSLGLNSKGLPRKGIKSGDVVEKNGKKILHYFVNEEANLTAGALPRHILKAKANKRADEIIIIAALNNAGEKNVVKSRQKCIDEVNWWQTHYLQNTKFADHILCVPHTQVEVATSKQPNNSCWTVSKAF